MSTIEDLRELVEETLVQKNRRLRQAKCKHEEIYCSTVTSAAGTFETRICLDCGKTWNNDRWPADR